MTDQIAELIARESGIFLDLGCGDHKEKGSIGMDHTAYRGVDIVHNIEDIPWPLPDECCYRILASHIIEHLPPNRMLSIIAECHRVLKVNGQLLISMPYGMSARTLQDPTHYRGWIESTPRYWDCENTLWATYKPPCFKIELNQWNALGDLNVIMAKRGPDDHGPMHDRVSLED